MRNALQRKHGHDRGGAARPPPRPRGRLQVRHASARRGEPTVTGSNGAVQTLRSGSGAVQTPLSPPRLQKGEAHGRRGREGGVLRARSSAAQAGAGRGERERECVGEREGEILNPDP